MPLLPLLKDADVLDRVRINDLDPNDLRHPEAKAMITFAEESFERIDGIIPTREMHFQQVWELSRDLASRSG